jgi:phenylacetate-CoA ligase
MKHALGTLAFTAAAFMRLRMSRAHMERYQLKRLKSLLRHADRNVPFYRDWFRQHGFHPQDIRSLADLSGLPPIDKQRLKTLRESFTADEIERRRLIEHQTSGSTGMPVSFLRAPHEERRLNMLRWRMRVQFGLRPGDRLAKVKTNWEPLSPRFNRLLSLARATGLLDSRIFDCLNDPAGNYRKIVEFQPTSISGYPGAVARIAEQHLRQKGRLDKLRRVGVGGETLTQAHKRLISEAFGVPIHDSYGTTECNLAAWQCHDTGLYHVNDDGILLEVCRDGVPVADGERGEIVITSLHSRTMPVIRYAMGDIAVAGPSACPCGSPFSTLRSLRGRTLDYLRTSDGRDMHPFELLNEIVLADEDWIMEYQFIQQEADRYRLLIVPRREITQSDQERIRNTLLDKLGPDARLTLEIVDAIPADRSGKLHFCRSEMNM